MTRDNLRLALGIAAVGAMGYLGAMAGFGGAGAVPGVALFVVADRRGLFGRRRQRSQ